MKTEAELKENQDKIDLLEQQILEQSRRNIERSSRV
jgi:hypothetical protein